MQQNDNKFQGFKKEYIQNCQISGRSFAKTISIKLTNNKDLIYIIDGRIIKIEELILGQGDEIKDIYLRDQVIENLEQIKYLKWIGDYGMKQKKVGKWSVIWRGSTLDIGGSYTEEGKKQGQWKEIYINYDNNVQVYEMGEYKDDMRKGVWKIIYDGQVIGGGSYDENGMKNGQWVELHKEWRRDKRDISTKGEYRNSKKIGRWDIINNKNGHLIGGGSYDEKGWKNGKWVEIQELWDSYRSVQNNGEYINGHRHGEWIIIDQENKKIGGGSYDENGMKNGEWIEIIDEWNAVREINFKGVYKNGKKIGIWHTLRHKETKFGGGQYNENGLKSGKWIELHDEWKNWEREVTYVGEYQQGIKKGRWDILLNGNQNIGGGQYDEDGLQNDKWVELCDGWEGNGGNIMQFTYCGRYFRGKKIEKWDTLDKENKIMGGGEYDENGMKNGKWIQQHRQWRKNFREITFQGEYNNGQKIGYWNSIYNCDKIVGGGLYNQKGNKDGKWIELDHFWDKEDSAITFKGEYLNGRKYGKWDIISDENYIIGGGSYDQNGMQNGPWIEIEEVRNDSQEISLRGEYNKGKKYGKWETNLMIYGNREIIETREYDENGLIIGK
ncbi:unnamed protein product [Paramecium sonneborni]|uniref:Uncharacterized protein n=1 Tax=Paramecium sonneborni TaxID=65129 RepID=A0A8S1MA61_9CILI|nr:unnamed protein product [Paramecium sonneborni]